MKRKMIYFILVPLVIISGVIYYYYHKIVQPVNVAKLDDISIAVDASQLEKDVKALCNIKPARSFANPAALDAAKNYIKERLSNYSTDVQEQAFDVAGNTYYNVRAIFPGKSKSLLVVGAHYDVCGDQAGADDNASGVAGLLALAELLKGCDTLPYTVELVAYSLEEPPNFGTENMGSFIHANSLHQQKKEVRAMIALEMIGYFTDAPNSQSYPIGVLKGIYPSVGNYIAVVGSMTDGAIVKQLKTRMKEVVNIGVESINAPSSIQGLDFSDHRNYWQFNYKAMMVTNTAFFRNKHYHEKSDLPETLDYVRMAEVVKGVFWGVKNFK